MAESSLGSGSRTERRRVAVVAGGSRGIGRAIALRLARDCFAVAVNARSAEDVEAVVEEVRSAGVPGLALVGDVCERGFVFDAVARTAEELGGVDVMVANAGVVRVSPFLQISADEFDHVLRVNLYGAVYCMQAAAEMMIANGRGGKILLANSVSGHVGVEFLASYCASKFGLMGIAQSAARELAAHGITVNSYCPGVVPTDMWMELDRELGAMLGYGEGEMLAERGRRVAMGRLEAPEDVAGLVSYLASKDADYMTGQAIVIDGGLTIR